jgi:hypothetical protein
MDHIGPCFDPTDRMGLGGDEHGTDGDEAGRRFFVDDGVTPAGTHVTGLPGPRQEPAAYQRQAPACWSAKREAADWSREHDAGLLAREERFAAERARLRLEVLFAANTHTIGN